MGKRGIFVFLILNIFLISLISAAPVIIETPTFVTGYVIEFTPIDTHKNGKDIQFNAHVFNISNGVEVDNTNTNCRLSVFNGTGHHVINSANMTYVDVPVGFGDWEFTAKGGNFTTDGEYGYLID